MAADRRVLRRGLHWAGVSATLTLTLSVAGLSLCAARHTPKKSRGGARALSASVPQHVVESGDTLWDITDKTTGKPWMWPQVWAMNPEITNPHWIFPGDIVRFEPPTEGAPSRGELIASAMDVPQATDAEVDRGLQGPKVEVINTAPPPSRQKRDMVQRAFTGNFVTPLELADAGQITNAVADKVLQRPGDHVYVTFPKDKTPRVGARYLIYRTVRRVEHPATHKPFGYMTEICGSVTMEELEGNVGRGLLGATFREVERGQFVTPVAGDLMVSVRNTPTTKAISGVVVAVEGDHASVGEQQLVFLDKGKSDGLERGNQLQVRSRGDPVTGAERGLPALDLATLLIVDVKETSSTALVVEATREVWPGDPVRTVGPSR